MNTQISTFIETKSKLLNTGNFQSQLNELTKLLPIQLPSELHELYSYSNGYKGYEGFESIQLWSLDKIMEEYLDIKDEHLRFADSMLCAPWIGWSLKDGNFYKGYGLKSEYDGKAELLTDRFDEILGLLSKTEMLY